MASKIKLLVAIDMLFLLLLAFSGSTAGITSEIFYYLAFLAPVFIALNYIYNLGENSHASLPDAKSSMRAELKRDFTLSKEGLLLTLPIIVPSIIGILGLSIVTSFFMGAFGYANETEINEPFIVALFMHALVPAVLEELLFRFAPIKLLADNKKTAFLLSSVMFAFAHANLFQIPYAFLAGFIFSGLYMMTGSILPSMLLHFLNNAFSLLSIYGYLNIWVYLVSLILWCVSIAVIVKRRSYYGEKIKSAIPDEAKIEISYHPLIFIGTSLVLAIFSLLEY